MLDTTISVISVSHPPATTPRRSDRRQKRARASRLAALALASMSGGLAALASPSPASASPQTETQAEAGTSAGATAAQCATDPDAPVPMVQVSGRLDPVMVDFVQGELRKAEEDCTLALALQLNSNGAVGNEDGAADLIADVAEADVPVVIWVGPSGSKATGAAADLLAVADQTAVARGGSVEVTPGLLEARGVDPADLGDVDVGDQVGAERAVDLDLIDADTSVIGDFALGIEGFESRPTDDGERREPVTRVVFVKLPILGQLMHTVASPAVAYLLFVIGLALLLFELYTAGVGVAGLVGAGSVLLGSYGLATLPTRPLAVGLLLLAMFAYGVDVQTGVPRLWSGIATVAFVLGSVALFDGMSVSWITLVIAVTGMTLGMLAGMPTMVRSRFATPTIGRDWMVGELGRARTAISPDGVVVVRDAPWRARTNRATPIEKDDTIRVVAIEGLVLEVEPESGGAQDYRERAKQRG